MINFFVDCFFMKSHFFMLNTIEIAKNPSGTKAAFSFAVAKCEQALNTSFYRV